MKKMLERFLRLLTSAALLIGMLWLAERCFDTDQLWRRYDELHPLLLIGALLAGVLLARLLMRIGFAAGALCSGWRLAELSLFSLGLHRDDRDRLRVMFRRGGGYFLLLVTPPRLDGGSPYRPYTVAGMALCAVLGAAALLTALLMRRLPEMLYLYVGALMPLVSAVIAVLPFAGDNAVAGRLRRLGGSVHLRRAVEHYHCVRAANRRGVSIMALSEEIHQPYPEEEWMEPLVYGAECNVCSWRLSNGLYEEAYEVLSKLMTHLDRPDFRYAHKEINRLYLNCSGAIAEMMTGRPPCFSERLNEPNIELFLGYRGWQERLTLAKYMRELLVTHDEAAAERLLTTLNEQLGRLDESSARGTRRILADAEALAATHTQEENEHV